MEMFIFGMAAGIGLVIALDWLAEKIEIRRRP